MRSDRTLGEKRNECCSHCSKWQSWSVDNPGQWITKELLDRGHTVKAVVRTPAKVPQTSALTTAQSNLSSVDQIAKSLRGADAVVSSYGPAADNTREIVPVTKRIAPAAKQNSRRLLVVGGAGSLEVAPGVTLLASGYVPEPFVPITKAHADAFANLKKSDSDWTYFSPTAFFELGERTDKFRLGKDELIADASGTRRISMEDYAIAAVDELEHPARRGSRFTIGY
jgi:uncharacterized protein